MQWKLHNDDGGIVETIAVCKICGVPTQCTTSACWTNPNLLQRFGIWLFRLNFLTLTYRHLEQ